MKIIVKRTKLFHSGGAGEAPIGTAYTFDVLEHPQFNQLYAHMHHSRYQACAQALCDTWNRAALGNWKYEVVEGS